MNKNVEKEEKRAKVKGQKKDNKSGKVNKARGKAAEDGKADADDVSNRFPNFSNLTEEERQVFFQALTEARKNVEARGVPTRRRFGTVHDEYLKYFEQDNDKKAEADPEASTPPRSDPGLEDGPRPSAVARAPSVTPKKTKPRPPSPQTRQGTPELEKRRHEAVEGKLMDQCETMIRQDTNQMVNVYLKKKKKNEARAEGPRADGKRKPPSESKKEGGGRVAAKKKKSEGWEWAEGRPKSRDTPRYNELTTEEKEIFFSTLQEARNNIVGKHPHGKGEVLPMEAIASRYCRGERPATSPGGREAARGGEGKKNLRVKVTLTSGDNERIFRAKTQNNLERLCERPHGEDLECCGARRHPFEDKRKIKQICDELSISDDSSSTLRSLSSLEERMKESEKRHEIKTVTDDTKTSAKGTPPASDATKTAPSSSPGPKVTLPTSTDPKGTNADTKGTPPTTADGKGTAPTGPDSKEAKATAPTRADDKETPSTGAGAKTTTPTSAVPTGTKGPDQMPIQTHPSQIATQESSWVERKGTDNKGTLPTSADAKGTPTTSADAKGTPATTTDAKGTPTTSADAKGTPTTSADAKGTPATSTDAKGTPTTSADAKGTPTTSADAKGTPTTSTDAKGTPTTSADAKGTPTTSADAKGTPTTSADAKGTLLTSADAKKTTATSTEAKGTPPTSTGDKGTPSTRVAPTKTSTSSSCKLEITECLCGREGSTTPSVVKGQRSGRGSSGEKTENLETSLLSCEGSEGSPTPSWPECEGPKETCTQCPSRPRCKEVQESCTSCQSWRGKEESQCTPSQSPQQCQEAQEPCIRSQSWRECQEAQEQCTPTQSCPAVPQVQECWVPSESPRGCDEEREVHAASLPRVECQEFQEQICGSAKAQECEEFEPTKTNTGTYAPVQKVNAEEKGDAAAKEEGAKQGRVAGEDSSCSLSKDSLPKDLDKGRREAEEVQRCLDEYHEEQRVRFYADKRDSEEEEENAKQKRKDLCCGTAELAEEVKKEVAEKLFQGMPTSTKVMIVDDNVIDKIRKLIYYLEAKAGNDARLEQEYIKLLVDYVDYLSKVLEALVRKKESEAQKQVQSAYSAEVRHDFPPTLKHDLANPYPRSVSAQEFQKLTEKEKKKRDDKRGKEKRPAEDEEPSSSSSSSDDDEDGRMEHYIPPPVTSKKVITTKIRMLQDLLSKRAQFVQESSENVNVVTRPEEKYVPPPKPQTVKLTSEEEEEEISGVRDLKILRFLIKCFTCGRKRDEDDGIFENLKGEAVRVDVCEGKARDAANATLNSSTMEVLKAAGRKRVIEKFYSKM